jgi:hypothetical protein
MFATRRYGPGVTNGSKRASSSVSSPKPSLRSTRSSGSTSRTCPSTGRCTKALLVGGDGQEPDRSGQTRLEVVDPDRPPRHFFWVKRRRCQPQRLDPARPDLGRREGTRTALGHRDHLARPGLRLRGHEGTPRRAGAHRRLHPEEAQARIEGPEEEPTDGPALAARADQLAAVELRVAPQEHRPQNDPSARTARSGDRLHPHHQAHRLTKPLVTGFVAYPLSL